MLVLITGASSGFGKLTVPRLLEQGHTVIAGIRGGASGAQGSEGRLQANFAEELRRFPGHLHAMDLDMEVSSSLGAAGRLVDGRFGGQLDVLINNAGFGLMGILEDQSESQIRQQMEVNFLGTVFLTRALLPALRRARGRILNVSSIAGMVGFPFYSSYCASKFALEGFMECLKYDLRPFGVQVAMIEPGGFKTGFSTARSFGERSFDPASPYFARNRAFLRIFDRTSARRLADPAIVARLIARLCETKRLRFRNWVGRDARVIHLLRAFLPECIRFALVARIFETALGAALKAKDET